MLDYKEYGADWPDIPYMNFTAFAEGICKKHAGKPFILYRESRQTEFTVWTFAHYYDECKRIARGLLAAGLKRGDRVVLWAENRPEWMAVWMGTAIAGCTVVPVDFLISDNEAANIITLTAAKAFFFSARKTEFADALTAPHLVVKAQIPESGNKGQEERKESDGGDNSYSPVSYYEFGINDGSQPLTGEAVIAGCDPVSIVFTSGTTGFAKGVMLSHKGLIANVSAALRMLTPNEKDIFIDVLPLHHTYPTTCSFLAPFAIGVPVILVERLVGDVVIRDIRDGGGTFLISVPLLYDKVKTAIDAKYQKTPFPVKFVLDLLRKKALAEAKKGNPEFGRRVFKFIRKKAGLDSIGIMVGGGGALNPATADFFDSFGFNIVHGYGMSENSPLISVNTARHKRNVSVGLPVKYTSVRIVDKDCDTRDLPPFEDGEIIVKSPSLMLGYYENPEATAEMFTSEGYLKTGDLGYRDNEGFIYINGRKKNLIVSGGGKNIYPEEIESHFANSRVIGEILVLGRKDAARGGEFIFAIVYPNKEALAEDYGERANNAAFVQKLVKAEIERENRKLAASKKISDFTLRDAEFEKNAQKKIRRFLYKDYEDAALTPL
ncbi:MAG: AMP-binding protein [Spirochaetaceae bacterium]|jgi:long-chain acyl-CoA synthetase|nr:AMP-binding protein [Spirochaetaceae bacterium]